MPRFSIHLIKPTRYDDDGYPLQWWRSFMPSNSLACLEGIVRDAAARQVLGADVAMDITVRDELHNFIDIEAIIREARETETRVFVGLVGVQSNQFPRAVDLARRLRAGGVPVVIGGFHVSGCLSMLKVIPPDVEEALALGISLFAGEAEDGKIDEVLRDAYAGTLKPIYNHLKSLPNLAGAPLPVLSLHEIARNATSYAPFDLGRGCPFECSFCTIINVQGRKSRFRTADDLEAIIRANRALGVSNYFITDDNFARNRHWPAFLDRLIALRAEGIRLKISIQIDTLAYKQPGFIEKCVAAGVDDVFIGLENINSDSLEAAKKRQNRIEDYRAMLLAWKRHPVFITCGYIIGFPQDTRESVLRDVDIIKRELPIDALYFNILTPLPGSEDHKKLAEAGVWMDPDMNKYDLNHAVTAHPTLSLAELDALHKECYARYYTFEHMERVLRRSFALGSNKRKATTSRLVTFRDYMRLWRVSMLEAGHINIRRRGERRPTLPLESPLRFYPREAWRHLSKLTSLMVVHLRMRRVMQRLWKDPDRRRWRDAAMAEPRDSDQVVQETRTTDYAQTRQARTAAR